ncbi:MAG: hypothetical protein V3T54_08175 [Acidobacteriota bacterium]
MPKWAKVLLIVVGVGVLMLGIAGYLGAKALKKGIDNFEKTMENAKVDGEVFGMTGTQEECLEETADLSVNCQGIKLLCAPTAGVFIWACLESATHEETFCEGVPPSSNGHAVRNWSEKKCRQYGQAHEETCIVALSMGPAFCDSKRER